jgi:predicted ATP-grasp superfamily ATP-dependent carboligase
MAVEHLRWHQTAPPLNEAIMLAAFVRKNGRGLTAVASLTHLVTAHEGQLIAEIEPDEFFDFTVTSPALEREDDQPVLVWPQNRIYRLQQQSSHDVLVMLGTEPHLRWPSFAAAVRQFMSEAGVRQLIVVYSWPGDTPHTRPILLQLTTEDADLAQGLSLPGRALNYVGPVDFGTTLLRTVDPAIPAAGLSAIVPNYLGVVPNPFGMLALIEAYDRLCNLQTDVEHIRDLADQVRAKADEGVADSEELAEAIRQMEKQYDEVTGGEPGITRDAGEDGLPTSELLRDIEAFLNQGKDAAE